MYWQWHHNELIRIAKRRKTEGYTEKHHIDMNRDNNNPNNLVNLYPREHWLIHRLLVILNPGEIKYKRALYIMMARGSQKYGKTKNNRIYEKIRKEVIELQIGQSMSDDNKLKLLISNKTRKYSQETRDKIGVKSKGRYFSDEVKEKMSIAGQLKIISKEAKANMSKAQQRLKGTRPCDKLDNDLIREIKRLNNETFMTRKEIANKVGVSRTTVGRALLKHI